MIKINKKIILSFVLVFGFSFLNVALASDINLTIRDGANIVYTGTVTLPGGTKVLTDSTSATHSIDGNSVLSLVDEADQSDASWNISELTWFSGFSSLYLKSINYSGGNMADNWQYVVDGTTPFTGMDQNVLVGGETVYLYFGNPYRVVLNSNSISTAQNLNASAQSYDYTNNTWIPRTGVTIGATQPDINNPFTPFEIATQAVDGSGDATISGLSAGSYNIGIQQDFYFPTESLTVSTPVVSSGGGGGVLIILQNQQIVENKIEQRTFDIKKAYEFLLSQQKSDGSFGDSLYTDWASLALASSIDYTKENQNLKNYLSSTKLQSQMLTDYERSAMALMSLGLNPYNTNNENYIKKITDSFDGKQFGDIEEDNDDIFALIVLQNAGYTVDDAEIKNSLSFILSKQKADGSWDESVDMTGASLQALAVFKNNTDVEKALELGKKYLLDNQQVDGGWKNISSTGWAIGGLNALRLNPDTKNYLADNQDTDGGIKNTNLNNKIWETSYVLTALSGKTWNQIMQKFEKQKTEIVLPKIETKKETKIITAKKKVPSKVAQIASVNTASAISALPENPIKKESKFKKFFKKFFRF